MVQADEVFLLVFLAIVTLMLFSYHRQEYKFNKRIICDDCGREVREVDTKSGKCYNCQLQDQ